MKNRYAICSVVIIAALVVLVLVTSCAGNESKASYQPPTPVAPATFNEEATQVQEKWVSVDERLVAADPSLTDDDLYAIGVYLEMARSLVASGKIPRSAIQAERIIEDINMNYQISINHPAANVLVHELQKVYQP